MRKLLLMGFSSFYLAACSNTPPYMSPTTGPTASLGVVGQTKQDIHPRNSYVDDLAHHENQVMIFDEPVTCVEPQTFINGDGYDHLMTIAANKFTTLMINHFYGPYYNISPYVMTFYPIANHTYLIKTQNYLDRKTMEVRVTYQLLEKTIVNGRVTYQPTLYYPRTYEHGICTDQNLEEEIGNRAY